MVSVVELRDYLDFAAQTAYEAGRLTLGYFQTDTLRTEIKPDDTPVTAADREAEELIRARIAAEYPGHAVVGEEYGVEGPTRPASRSMAAKKPSGDWSGNETIYAREALSTTTTLLPEVLHLIRGRTGSGRGKFPAPRT